MVHHFGSSLTGLWYAEKPVLEVTVSISGVDTPVRIAPRPAGGEYTLQVKNDADGTTLSSTAVDGSGFWSYTTDDIGIILVSLDGVNWVRVFSAETMLSAMLGGLQIQQALDASSQAVASVAAQNATVAALSAQVTALAAAVGSGGGVTSINWNNVPANSVGVVIKAGSSWPARPTDRTDVSFLFIGASPFPSVITSGTAGYYDGVDVILEKP
jgi:hypothetical protein